MSKLVKGDVVICVDADRTIDLIKGGKYIVNGLGQSGTNDMVSLLDSNNQLVCGGELYFMHRFVKVNITSVDAAKKLLEAAGYVVTKPKPVPEFGQVWKANGCRNFLVTQYLQKMGRVQGVYEGDCNVTSVPLELLHADYELDKS